MGWGYSLLLSPFGQNAWANGLAWLGLRPTPKSNWQKQIGLIGQRVDGLGPAKFMWPGLVG